MKEPVVKDLKLNISFLFLMVAMLVGLLLRYQFVYPIEGLNFKHFLHAHSHVTILGWGFNAIFIGIVYSYLKKNEWDKKLNRLFWAIQVSILGALISFPIQGYAAFSIAFSTIFLILTYWFYAYFLKLSKGDHSVGGKFFKWGMLYLVISGVGPWSLGAIIANDLKETIWYPLSVYFYLHFLYNGFMLFAVFGLWFKVMDQNGVAYNQKKASRFFSLMNIAILPTFALSALWFNGGVYLNVIGIVGGALQLIALVYLLTGLNDKETIKKVFSIPVRALLYIVLFSFVVKLLLQFASGFQSIAEAAFVTKGFTIIGYIHLVMLAIITLGLLAYFVQIKKLNLSTIFSKAGVVILVLGIILSEFLLFGQGGLLLAGKGLINQFYFWLLIASALMPLGMITFYISQFFTRNS